ncbi:LppU/SCO3897 family protein [Actinosynnema sp. CA-299493]
MSNEPSRPVDDVPAGAGGDPAARPDVPPADAARIAASRDAAAAADERELSTPASSGLGSGAGSAEPGDTTPEPGASVRERPVAGNEPATPAGPTGVPGARPAPAADPVASVEPASGAPAANGTGKSGGGRKVLIGVLVVLLIGLVVYGVRHLTSDPANAEVGDCVSVAAESDNRAEVDTLACSADKASYKVGKVLDATDATCPEDGLYTEIVPAGGVGDGYKLCLLPNMAEGVCYRPDEGTGFVKSDCKGPETIKVTKVIEGSSDLEACADAAGMAYPEPPVTYCLEPAEL